MPVNFAGLGIAMCACSYGKEASFAGKYASASITVTPKAIGVGQLRLTWAATGDIFSSFSDSTLADSGTPGIINLPQTGQTGFKHGTSTFKDWYYEAVITSLLDDGQALTRVYRFQIPAGTTTLDLDTLDEDGTVTALPASAPIPSINALTRTAVKTAAYTAATSDLVPVDATSAPVTVTLPTAPADKSTILVKKIDTSTNTVTVAAGGSDVFNKTGGGTSVTLQLQYQAVTLQYDATNAIWTVLNDDLPLGQLDLRYPTAASIAAAYVTKGPSQPTPPAGTEYVWMKTDGAGHLLDILSGIS